MQLGNLRAMAIGTAALLLGLGTGCHTGLQYERYRQIRENESTAADVSRLLGEPSATHGLHWMYECGEQDGVSVFVDFDPDGRVCRKQWVDLTRHYWVDSSTAGGGW